MQKIPARKKLLFFITLITTSFVASAQNGWSAEIEMEGSEGTTLTGKVMATFDQPWAMTFLPDGHSLVTEKEGVIWLLDKNQQKRFSVENVPDVTARGQGGLGDVIIHPDWGEHTLNISKGDMTILQPNVTFHMIAVMQFGNWGVEASEAIRVTEKGCELFCNLSKELHIKS